MSNIVGLDLKIDENYLADAVKQTVMKSIVGSLNGKNEIISQIVNAVLKTKVDASGKISYYSDNDKYTLLEYLVRNIIEKTAREELAFYIENKGAEIAKRIKEIIECNDFAWTASNKAHIQ
jgi:hypothetical protein